MKCNKLMLTVTLVFSVFLTMAGCGRTAGSLTDNQDTVKGWSAASHGNVAAPDYDVVFPQDKVNEIKITISTENWEAMQANMAELFGTQGTGQQGGMAGGGQRPGGNIVPGDGNVRQGSGFTAAQGDIPQRGNMPGMPGNDRLPADNNDEQPPAFGQPGGGMPEMPGGRFPADNDEGQQFIPPQPGGMAGGQPPGVGGPGFGGDMTAENPMWVESTIEFNGNTWTHVGVRYKGNSSLMSGWRSSTGKLPLKLDFDEFETEYPEIENQRFYGFKQLTLSNAYSDSTYLRETLTSDILLDAGLMAAETAYYNVTLDYGEGEVDLGLYVMVEVVDDTVIEREYGDDSGNIYEGDGTGVSLASGTYNRIESSFQKENNEDEADWSDIETLYNVLHSGERLTDPAAWRNNLEEVFDTDAFLEWLAISAVIQNWDNYGSMSHNFYLYNNPATGQIEWISWDHNMVLGVSGGGGGRDNAAGGGPAMGGGPGRSTSFDKSEVGENWPLIRYLLDDPVYYEKYISYLEETIKDVFVPEKLNEKCRELAELIAPYVTDGTDTTAYDTAVQQLQNRITERYQAATSFLAEQD
jgi:spore coat protein H